MTTAIALFTRDLRVHDNPVLAAAAAAEHTVALFVRDREIARLGFAGRHRDAFLVDALHDLDASLRRLGAPLVTRRGDVVAEVVRLAEQVGAARVHVAADGSGYAVRREQRLRAALGVQRRELVVHEAVHTVLAPGAVTPAGSDHFAVFTPYWRRWSATPTRALAAVPARLRSPQLWVGTLPAAAVGGARVPGGEAVAREHARRWLPVGLAGYADRHDQLSPEGTSRLSPYLHLGCLSALELATWASEHGGAGAQAFLRQLAWRDFFAQLLAARPQAARADYRPRQQPWRDDPEALDAWRTGRTGYPVVDAGMRQLAAEGWMHNRARLITGSFLTKTLELDWREGAAHFRAHLLDADVANNSLNWQWVAGTGTDSRPRRRLNPLRQAARYDPAGDYVRRWVPELAGQATPMIHQPWRLPEPARRALGYPEPIVPPPASRSGPLPAG